MNYRAFRQFLMEKEAAQSKDPRLARAGVSGYDQVKRTPGHPTKSHIVVAKEGDRVKTIRFGQQGVKTNQTAGQREAFKSRHQKNIARGKMSAAYWADKAKWSPKKTKDKDNKKWVKGSQVDKIAAYELLLVGHPLWETDKLAYGEKEHRGLAGVTARGAGAKGQVRGLITQGALKTDKNIRHPWLPHTDNLHSFAGSQSRSQIGQGLRTRQQSAVGDITKSIAGAKGKAGVAGYLKSGLRGVRGAQNLGDTQHSLVDVNAHYNKPIEQGTASRLRSRLPQTGYGGGIVGGREHVNEEKLVKNLTGRGDRTSAIAEIDSLRPSANAQDASAVRRSQRFGSSSRRQVEAALVKQYGMSPDKAAKAATGFFENATFSGPSQRLGNLSRDAKYVGGEVRRAGSAVKSTLRSGLNLLRRA
jgi:hypothetical protein